VNQDNQYNRNAAIAVCIFLFVAVVVIYGQTLGHQFVNYDDDLYVYENSKMTRGTLAETAGWAVTSLNVYNWHPVTWLSHRLDCDLFGVQHPGGHHFVNLMLHAGVAIGLFLVLWQMTGGLWPSALAAALFAVHPLRVESVAWVSERKDLLSGLFFVLTLAAYLGYVRRPFSWKRYGLVVGAFALGLMSKPMLVTLPFVLLLLDYWPLARIAALGGARRAAGRLIGEKVPLFALSAASCAVTMLAQRPAMASFRAVPLLDRIENAVVSYATYLGQFFYPSGLTVFYPLPEKGHSAWAIAGATALLIVLTVAAWMQRQRRPYWTVGWFWFLGMLVPVIGLVQVGLQATADRYTYLPQIGLSVALAWGAWSLALARPRWQWAVGATAAAGLAVLVVCATRQAGFWRDSETLWTRALECTENNALAHNNLGMALASRRNVDAAVEQFEKATEIAPTFNAPHHNLGEAMKSQGRFAEAEAVSRKAEQNRFEAAIQHYRKALRFDPGSYVVLNNLGNALAAGGRLDEAIAEYQKALSYKPNYADAHNNLGNALAAAGRTDEAVAAYRLALKYHPEFAEAHGNLGAILAGRGQLDAAIGHFQDALKLKPEDATTHNNLGIALAEKGEMAEALKHWREAIRLNPNDIRVVHQLAWTSATHPDASVRNGAAAIELARWAVMLSRGADPVALDTLGAAYAEAGFYTQAKETAQKALDLAKKQKDPQLAESIEAKIALYAAGAPYRDSAGVKND